MKLFSLLFIHQRNSLNCGDGEIVVIKRANSHLRAVFTIEFTYIDDYIQMNFNRIPYKIARQYIFNVDERPPNFTRRTYVMCSLARSFASRSTSKHSNPTKG